MVSADLRNAATAFNTFFAQLAVMHRLQSIHRTVLELRKQAALSSATRSQPFTSIPGSEASSEFTASYGGASTAPNSRNASKAGAPGAPGAAQERLAELGAKAEAAASRPLVMTSAVDSSLQAVQLAKESLQSMHDKDITLKLFSQSVQDVLARKVWNEVCAFALPAFLQRRASLINRVLTFGFWYPRY